MTASDKSTPSQLPALLSLPTASSLLRSGVLSALASDLYSDYMQGRGLRFAKSISAHYLTRTQHLEHPLMSRFRIEPINNGAQMVVHDEAGYLCTAVTPAQLWDILQQPKPREYLERFKPKPVYHAEKPGDREKFGSIKLSTDDLDIDLSMI